MTRFTSDQVSDFIRAYQEGHGLVEIASWHGTNPVTVRQYLLRNGVQTRPRGPRSPRHQEADAEVLDRLRPQIVAQYAAGNSMTRVAENLFVSASTVSRVLHDQPSFVPNRYRSFTVEEAVDLVRQYETGETTVTLADKYGVTDRAIRAAIALGGGKTRTPPESRRKHRALMAEKQSA